MFGLPFKSKKDRSILPGLVTGPKDALHRGMPLSNGAGLVKHYYIHPSGSFQAFGVFDENASLGSLAYSHHDSCRGSQSQGTRTGNNKHSHQRQQSVGQSVCAAQCQPKHQGEQGDTHDDRHKDGSHPVYQLLHRGLRALCVLHHADNLSQQSVCPYPVGSEAETPFLVDGTGIDLIVPLLGNRDWLTAQHALIHVRGTVRHRAVHSHTFTWLDENEITGTYLLYAHFLHGGILEVVR